ncbi:hypothetical protein [Cryobacterium sp. M96]|uniref:hypothetical protein n=1 Tax=Cryobacterium sp. M96 TaxID=2048295 RepID=UPI000CE5531A|nr:hypothetical protein [Cryobacterium sp. M96]
MSPHGSEKNIERSPGPSPSASEVSAPAVSSQRWAFTDLDVILQLQGTTPMRPAWPSFIAVTVAGITVST